MKKFSINKILLKRLMPKMLSIKKILCVLIICCSFDVHAQESQSFYGRMNYGLVPHNILQGVGYAIGYQWNADKPLSLKIETGMISTFRDRKMNFQLGDIRYLDLYYNLAQMNLAIIPTWQFIRSEHWQVSAGVGFSGAYQSKIFTTSHYEYRNSPTSEYWTSVYEVDVAEGIHAGLLGELDIRYLLSKHWHVGFSAQYQVYDGGEAMLVSGLGVGYKF
jgi:hypothetical protein